ncbi:GTPase/DUF3482 domain-containing protein [Pseudidiomarina sp. WS423]|uniref:GTPase/DUF3482 domain-containing protein n=1 Tax=Pseudidiomarina sp. WS423 TaxID=3425124 RepID=UPI003D6E2248
MATRLTALQLAVVGHTNTGKTSLLRTLLHDSQFGEVASRPSTTRDVLTMAIGNAEQVLVELYDTPGLEAGSDLFESLSLSDAEFRHDGAKQIHQFLNSTLAETEFAQEAKVLRQLLKSDAALYVIDVRDPVLPKYQDELAVLMRCGKPLLPVLNFTATTAGYSNAWQQALAQVNLHSFIEFDAVSPPEGGEAELLTRLKLVVKGFDQQLNLLIEHREQQRQQRLHQGLQQIAELLTDVAALQHLVSAELDSSALQEVLAKVQRQVTERERRCVQDLLALYEFNLDVVALDNLDISTGHWHDDLFDTETLAEFGIKAGLGVGSGAAVGAGFDLLVGGASLGAGTLLGATIGGLWQGWQHYGKQLKHKLQGQHQLIVEDPIILLLAVRQLQLLQQLSLRGHGATNTLLLSSDNSQREQELSKLKSLFKGARKNPQWSTLAQEHFINEPERATYIDKLVAQLTR